MQQYYKFNALLLHKIWGGNRLARFKNMPEAVDGTGESWELADMGDKQTVVISGPDAGLSLHDLMLKYGTALTGGNHSQFPLLVKFIDAGSDLSVQVHPNHEMAARLELQSGKNEIWYVVAARPGAKIYAGLRHTITPADYERMVDEKTVMQSVAEHDVKPGDVFYIPAGRVHAIGSGVLLAEIQQPSDVTYRIYDYDRIDADGLRRELHTDLARQALDYRVYDDYKTHYDHEAPLVRLIDSPAFTVDRLCVDGVTRLPRRKDTFLILMCIEGTVKLPDGAEIHRGETILIPAASEIDAVEGKATVLTAFV